MWQHRKGYVQFTVQCKPVNQNSCLFGSIPKVLKHIIPSNLVNQTSWFVGSIPKVLQPNVIQSNLVNQTSWLLGPKQLHSDGV